MATYKVHMLVYQPEYCVREVEVPDGLLGKKDLAEGITWQEYILERIFYFGQNDVRNIPGICSVSAGDVIEYDNKYFLVRWAGYHEISEAQYLNYLEVEREQRCQLIDTERFELFCGKS